VDLGVFILTQEQQYNFKAELIMDSPQGDLYQGDAFTGKVRVHNIGDRDGFGLFYQVIPLTENIISFSDDRVTQRRL
jgi:hypothetical protein